VTPNADSVRHEVTAVPVEKMDGGVIGYRFHCSCGRVGGGTHTTELAAIHAGQAHIDSLGIKQ
jgi:hypothetical protein